MTAAVERLRNAIEGALFAHRVAWLAAFAGLSMLLLWQALQLRPTASFDEMAPAGHPYIVNARAFENDLRPLGNVICIAVETTDGDIYSAAFLERLRQVNEAVFYIPGVDRGNLRSLFTPNTQWFEATEDGLRSGRVVPPGFAGSDTDVAAVRDNVAKAGLVGSLVAGDGRSAVLVVPLLERDPDTGARLDYGAFARRLEHDVRSRFETPTVHVHVIGFAELVGDLIRGARPMAGFMLLTAALTALLLQWFSRCWRSTLATMACCLLAVVWHLGLVALLGDGLDPYSMLVPFLTFAIGVSHAVQNINTMSQETLRGAGRVEAARATFRLLFVPGTVALLCDVAGFSTLLVIDVGAIRGLAVSASIGVAVVIVTKMFLLPVLMSYAGVSAAGRRAARRRHDGPHRVAAAFAALARPRNAAITVVVVALLAGWSWSASRQLQVGDLDPGAPELRPDSAYNRDAAFFARQYATSADVFVVIVKTPPGECGAYETASTVTRLQWALEETPGVQGTASLFDAMKQVIVGTYGGDLRWDTVTRNRYISNAAHRGVPPSLYNTDCSMLPVVAYLDDHRAATLAAAVRTVETFRASEPAGHATLLLAAGNAGLAAATNDVVERAWGPMLLLVYGIVAMLLAIEFRSLRVTLCLLVPLVITSLLCEAIMARLGLGVKVATLPVIALGVGIGVDYGIYLYNRLDGLLARGLPLREAWFETLRSTGRAVAFTGLTLAAGVSTWVRSDIKFQADMGLLLAFMFVWNMLGAIVLVPALAALLGVRPPNLEGNRP